MRILGGLGVLALSVATASADTGPAANIIVSTNVVDLAHKTFALGFDYAVAQHVAIGVELGYDAQTYLDSVGIEDHRGGLEGAFAARVFWSAPYQGPFASVELKMRSFSGTYVCNSNGGDDPYGFSCDESWSVWSPRALLGWQSTQDFGLSLSGAVGVGYLRDGFDRHRDGLSSPEYVAQVRVGYAF